MGTCSSVHGGALSRLLQIDPALVPIAEAAGPLPERPAVPGFAGLAGVVVSQLVSRASADAILARLMAATGPLTPESYLRLARGTGPRFGLTAAKADALVRVAEAIIAGDLDLEALPAMEAGEAIARLTAIKGIGPWTAEVHLLFHGGHEDIFPAGDLALRAAYAAAFGLAEKPDPSTLRARAQDWSPLRSTAARLFWAYYARLARSGGQVLLPPPSAGENLV